MWVKKTKDEQTKKITLSFLGNCLAVFILATIIFCFWNKSASGVHIESSDEADSRLPEALIFGFIIVGILIVRNYWRSGKVVLICPKCEEAKDDDGNYNCSCGDHYVDIKTMKRVDDKQPSDS